MAFGAARSSTFKDFQILSERFQHGYVSSQTLVDSDLTFGRPYVKVQKQSRIIIPRTNATFGVDHPLPWHIVNVIAVIAAVDG